MTKTYIYMLRRCDSGHVFYIGQTIDEKRRKREHFSPTCFTYNIQLSEYIQQYKQFIQLIKICSVHNCNDANKLECYFIELAQLKDILFNIHQPIKRINSSKNFVEFCLINSINNVEILDFSIFSK